LIIKKKGEISMNDKTNIYVIKTEIFKKECYQALYLVTSLIVIEIFSPKLNDKLWLILALWLTYICYSYITVKKIFRKIEQLQ